MQTYLVRRPVVAATANELDAILMRLRSCEEQASSPGVAWLHSYVLREPDGRFGTCCLCRAIDREALTDHAARVGIVAIDIRPVLGHIFFHDLSPDGPAVITAGL
jgi:hypothetical protein